MIVLRILAFVSGAAVVVLTLLSAVKTFVLPRAAPAVLGRVVFVALRRGFNIAARPSRNYEARDAAMAWFAPIGLLLLPAAWLLLVAAGFTLIYWGSGLDLRGAFVLSGGSITTLGYERPSQLFTAVITFIEATLGIGLVALLVSYLPTIYAAFSRREASVALLEGWAGTPPSPVELLLREQRIGGLTRLDTLWTRWQEWFADVEESHTSLSALVFFRSPDPNRSWITAAGCVLDSASLITAAVDIPRSPDAQLCIRAGYVALRRIADFFAIKYNPSPPPDAPISIDRSEFDEVYDTLLAGGLPMKPDREQAWRDFGGWRVNYDQVLITLAGLVMAPYARWSSDRGLAYSPPPLFYRGRR